MAKRPLVPKHRRVWFKVANALGRQDRKAIAFLMNAREEEFECGIDLLKNLERSGEISANDPYSNLIDLLLEVERNDIAANICFMDPEARNCVPSFPIFHAKLSDLQQLALMKRSSILRKRNEYAGCMKQLKVVMSSDQDRSIRFDKFFQQVFDQLKEQPDSCTMDSITLENLREVLTPLSQFWKHWPTALAHFQSSCSSLEIKHPIEHCHELYCKFSEPLSLDWASQTKMQVQRCRIESDHPIGEYARRAHHILSELSSELLGKQDVLSAATTTCKDALFTVESINYTARYMIPMFKWFVNLLHVISSGKLSTIQGDPSICEQLTRLVSDHAVALHQNWEAISSILGLDDQISSKLRKVLVPDPASFVATTASCIGNSDIRENEVDSTVHSSLVGTVGVGWYSVLVILAGVAKGYIKHFSIKPDLVKKIREFLDQKKSDRLSNTFKSLSLQMATCMVEEVKRFKHENQKVILELTNGITDSADLIKLIFDDDHTCTCITEEGFEV